jgi:hypothetical protein
MAAPTPDQIQAFKDRNRILPGRTPAQQTFDSRRGRGDADAQPGGFYGGNAAGGAAGATPPKASAAPVAGKQDIFLGLSTALNEYQQTLVKQKKREIADQYAIEFTESLVNSTVKRPGAQDATTAPMQTPDSAAKLDPATNSVNKNARTWPVKAGTQIIKVIDDVMRNSSYITEQQNVEVTTATDPVTGIQKESRNPKSTSNMQWYKISIRAEQIGYDTIIRDYAYKLTFIVTPYAIAQMISQYFPDSRYRGVHKSYQYWFTGANTQILGYEQNYNNAYRLFLSGIGPDAQQRVTTDFRDQNRYIYMPTSPDQATGAKNYANEPSNNGASFLYDPSSLATVKLSIVGDPAWLQQGEVALGVNARTFNFNPFNADGAINYDSQAVMFNVAFNTPADYDLATGIVDVNANNRRGQPQELYTYTAFECKSTFSKGVFKQELQGKLLIEKNINAPATGGRAVDDGSRGSAVFDETGQLATLRKNEYGDLYDPAGTAGSLLPPSPRPAPPPQPATSTGEIQNNTPSTEFGFEDAFSPATPTPRRNLGQNDIDFSTQSAVVPTPPQIMNRDT